MSAMFENILKTLRGLIYPAACFNCGKALSVGSETAVCALCSSSLKTYHESYCPACGASANACVCGNSSQNAARAAFSVLPYRGAARKLIWRLKINRDPAVVPLFRRLFANFVNERPAPLSQYDAIIPIPSHEGSGPEEASGVMARLLGSLLKAPVRHVLRRSRPTRKQSSLSKWERAHNVRGAYCVRQPLPYRSLLLVDDVLTTGSTAMECARALKAAGAQTVDIFACARSSSGASVKEA